MATKKSTTKPTQLSESDRAHNHGLDHGAQLGAHTKVIATMSVAHLKRGSSVTTNYCSGFLRGLKVGWQAA